MKKIFTFAAAMLASVSMFAALPLTALPEGGIDFANGGDAWGATKDKNKVIYNNANTIMMYSQGNALTFSENGMMIGNSSKVSAFVFRTSAAADITLNLGYNNSDATVTLYYMGEETDELTSSNLNTPGTKTCGSAAIVEGATPSIVVKTADAGYYKVVGSLRFAAKSIVLSAPTAADHSAATVTAIKADGAALADFAADKLSYDVELEFDATTAPIISADTGDDATVQITQATTVPGTATVVCTSYDQTNSVTYTINFTLESPAPIIRAILTSSSAATVKGSIGGTADVSLSSNLKMDKGKYFGIALPSGQTFMEGDSVVISMTTAGGNYPCLFEDKARTNCLFLATEGSSALEYTIMLPANADGISTLYLARDGDDATYKWNPVLKSISVYRPVDDGQPKLNVNPDSIALAVTAAIPADSAVVTFSGKNLAAGEYALTVPDLAGLTVNPASVTVGDDGKLNAAIKIKYATEATVDAASTAISLTIGELTKTVKVGYSAIQAKQYMSSINIEQLVLDNGKSYNINAALTAAHIDFANINDLDSLNDEKTKRNEPYLGLKIKAADAYVAGWLKANDTLSVKFGNVGDSIKVRINGQEQTIAKVDINSSVFGHRATADEYVEIITTSTSTVVLKQIMVNEPIADVILPAATKFEASCLILDHGTIKVGDNKSSAMYAPNAIVKITLTPNEGYYLVEWNVYKEGDASTKVTVSNDSTFIMPEYNVNVSAVLAQAEPVLYTVTLGTYEHGSVAFIEPNEGHQYAEGDTVRLIITPADGYELVSANAGNEALIPDEDGNCAFEMPAQDVTVTATFKAVTPEPVLYTVTLGTYEHGTVAFIEPNEGNKYEAGEEVRLSVTPDEGFEVETVKLEALNTDIPVVNGVATFNMPAQDVVVLATFKPVGEGFEYIDASTKAVKFFVNGKLLIKRGDKVFDAKGQIVE